MKKKNFIFVLISISLCLLAAVGGYRGARLLADEITTGAEINAEKAGLFKPADIDGDGLSDPIGGERGDGLTDPIGRERTVNRLRPVTLINVMDYEKGKVVSLALEVFDTVSMQVSFIYLDTDISYTMTGTLYRLLADSNVLVPQTVKFSELYSYYGNQAAFGAGKRIASELIGIDIDYYYAISKDDAPEDLLIERVTALGLMELYGIRTGKETDMTREANDSFENLSRYLADPDVKGYEAPVIRRNESCFADVIGIWNILREIGEYNY